MRKTQERWVHEMHDCGPCDEEAFFELKLMDAGGGEYLVLQANEIAFDTEAEIDAFSATLKSLLAVAKREEEAG